jgi:hypothetical protein
MSAPLVPGTAVGTAALGAGSAGETMLAFDWPRVRETVRRSGAATGAVAVGALSMVSGMIAAFGVATGPSASAAGSAAPGVAVAMGIGAGGGSSCERPRTKRRVVAQA